MQGGSDDVQSDGQLRCFRFLPGKLQFATGGHEQRAQTLVLRLELIEARRRSSPLSCKSVDGFLFEDETVERSSRPATACKDCVLPGAYLEKDGSGSFWAKAMASRSASGKLIWTSPR